MHAWVICPRHATSCISSCRGSARYPCEGGGHGGALRACMRSGDMVMAPCLTFVLCRARLAAMRGLMELHPIKVSTETGRAHMGVAGL